MLLRPTEARGGLSREAKAGMEVLDSLIPDSGWFDDVGRSLPACVDRVRGLRARALIILIPTLRDAGWTRCARYPGYASLASGYSYYAPSGLKGRVDVMTVRLVAYGWGGDGELQRTFRQLAPAVDSGLWTVDYWLTTG